MTESERNQIITLSKTGMPITQIERMMSMTAEEFRNAITELKANGEFPKNRKTCEDKIVEAYHRGERNPYRIAEQYGVQTSYVYSVLNNHGLPLGKKTRNFVHAERTNAIVEDLQDGELSPIEIARKHGVSRQYITKIKRKIEKGIFDDEQRETD